jgi:glutamyl-tRNA synthetase
MPNSKAVGRLAPSPSGLLHLGHARTFLIAWWHARASGGRVVMRIEDLDGARASREHGDAALRDLEWLGVDWDGPVKVQSQGIERLNEAVQTLLELGLAYPCVCTRGDVRTAQSAPHQGETELRYPGTCRGRFASVEAAASASGRAPGIRLRVPSELVTFDDRLFGPQSFDVQAEVGDFLIARRDGAPAYQLAVVVDDAAQGVTEVVRGSDLLASTARQRWLQRALGLEEPTWLHVPLVLDASGRRLAKREADLSLSELRARAVDARSVVGWAARSAGLEVPARATACEVLPYFGVERLRREPVLLTADALPTG